MDTRKFAERAAGALMVLSVTVRRYEGRLKLLDAGANAATNAGANPGAARLYIDLLGSNQKKLTALTAAFKAPYAYMNGREGGHFAPSGVRGEYLVPATRIPEALAKLNELRDTAHGMRDAFAPEYGRLLNLAKREDFGDWRREAASKAPSAEEISSKFEIIIGVPRPLQSYSTEALKKLNLPMDIAEAVANEGARELAERLEAARAIVIETAKGQMEVTATQLNEGKRLSDSLIENTRTRARTLRDFAIGYDHDPALIALADQMDESVNVKSKDVWNAVPSTREKSAKLATKALASLEKIAKVERKITVAPVAITPDKSTAKPKAKLAARGLLGKKLSK